MSGEKALSEAFLSGAPARCVPALRALPQLEDTLRALLEQARHAHPSLRFEPEAFLSHLAARLPPGAEAGTQLAALRAGDLLLAFACAQGDSAAFTALEEAVFSRVGEWFPREDSAVISELRQRLRQRLLLAEGPAAPKISTFTGRGALAQWTRAIATRLLIDLQREATGSLPLEEASPEAFVGGDPEFSFIRARYQEEFRQAFQQALAALTPKERNLLRLHHVDNLSVDSVGTMYQTSRSTAARWIAQARERLLECTRAALAERLKTDAAELDSLLGLLRSHLDVSLHRLLKP